MYSGHLTVTVIGIDNVKFFILMFRGDQGSSTASIPTETPMDMYGQPMSNVYGSNMCVLVII